MEKIKRNDNLKDFYDSLCLFYYGGINRHVLEYVISLLLPKDDKGNLLVKYNIKDMSDKNAAAFIPETNTVRLSMDSIIEWLDTNTGVIADAYDYSDIKRLRTYLLLFMILHEVEHSYQYLIAEDVIDASSSNIRNGYKLLYDMIITPKKNNYISNMRRLYHLKLYDNDHDRFVLERNANIEAADKLLSLSALEHDISLYQMFSSLRMKNMRYGYANNNLGSFDETMKKIKLFNKYSHNYMLDDMDEIDKIRYGLPVKEKSRELLLKKKF